MSRGKAESEQIEQHSSNAQAITPAAHGERRGQVSYFSTSTCYRAWPPKRKLVAHFASNFERRTRTVARHKRAAQFLGGIHHKTIQRMARQRESACVSRGSLLAFPSTAICLECITSCPGWGGFKLGMEPSGEQQNWSQL
jgi:hypothetical protein